MSLLRILCARLLFNLVMKLIEAEERASDPVTAKDTQP